MSKKPPAQKKRRILIVDDHPMLRQGLAQLIGAEPDMAVCGEAENAMRAMDKLDTMKPDLVLMDISLPDKNGLELIKDFRAVQPGLFILAISMHDESLYAGRVLRAGGRGYIMKQEGGKKLMLAIRQVLDGKIYVSEKISAEILQTYSASRSGAEVSPMEQLTDRELEVFQLIGQGKSTREVATKLHLSIKTIEAHRAHIKTKLNITSATELMRFAVHWTEMQKAKI